MFLNLGFKSVTMDDIASEMGISKKTIYAHFSTKIKLVEASSLYILQNISTGISEIRKQNHNPIEEVFEMKEFVKQHLKNEKSSPQFQLKKYYPKIFNSLQGDQLEIMDDCVTENLQRGIAEGYFRPSISVDFTSKIYFIGMMGIKTNDLFPEEDYDRDELTNKFLEYHLRSISTPKGLETLKEFITLHD